jgi:hypothetical protein
MDFTSTLEPMTTLFERLYRSRGAAYTGRDINLEEYRDTLVCEEKPVVEAIERRGYDLIGIGAGRIVFAIPDTQYVVKVARFGNTPADDGKNQNKNEHETWTTADSQLNLLEVTEADTTNYNWVVRPHIEQLDTVITDETKRKQVVDSLQNQLLNADVFIKLLDVRQENIGVNGQDILLMDYGLSGEN